MLFIRWDDEVVVRLVETATRAGFADVRLEPSPLSIARIAGADATYERRRAAQGEAHHAVLHHRLPVAALSTIATGRTHPDVDIAATEFPLAAFDELLDDIALAEALDRVAARTDASSGGNEGTSAPHLDLAGIDSVPYPDHDVRSPRRQAVALGAAVGAADLTGPIDRLRMVGPDAGIGGDPFDRPWAIETLPPGEEGRHDDAANGIERVTRWFRSHRPR